MKNWSALDWVMIICVVSVSIGSIIDHARGVRAADNEGCSCHASTDTAVDGGGQ